MRLARGVRVGLGMSSFVSGGDKVGVLALGDLALGEPSGVGDMAVQLAQVVGVAGRTTVGCDRRGMYMVHILLGDVAGSDIVGDVVGCESSFSTWLTTRSSAVTSRGASGFSRAREP